MQYTGVFKVQCDEYETEKMKILTVHFPIVSIFCLIILSSN